MSGLMRMVFELPAFSRVARTASDWVDLQWSQVIESLGRQASRARGRLLDVGCGDKPYEHLFRPYVSEYLGVEHHSTFGSTVASTSQKADVLYDGRRLPFPDASFDTVLCVQVLEHTPRPADLVMELARVLKNDGVLILSAPFSFRLHEEPHDYFRFSPHGLRELCARAGLEIVHIEPMGGLWTLLGHKLNTYLALQVGRAGELAQSLGKLGHEKQAAHDSTRVWTLPLVAPAMVTVALSARLLDRVIPDRTETLGFTLVGRRQQH